MPADERVDGDLENVAIDPATIVGHEGYYRVGRTESGQWWFLRPDGKPFIYKGCCTTGVWLESPPSKNRFAQTLKRLYGTDREAYYRDQLRLMTDLGFNAFGMWSFLGSDGYPYWDLGWPFVEYVHAREVSSGATVMPPKHVDVFDTDWQRTYDKAVARICERFRDNRNLLGYFTDNEPGMAFPGEDAVWGGRDATVAGKAPLMLQCFLTLPRERPGHAGAWTWLLERHNGDIRAVAAHWGAAFDSVEGFLALHEEGLAFASEGFIEDNAAFIRYFVGEYQRITGGAFRRHDPHHLVLGCRHGAHPGRDALEAYDPKYVDVVSMNTYRPYVYEELEDYSRYCDLPVLTGEFSWTGLLEWNKFKDGHRLNEDELDRCRRRGVEALELAFTHPNYVGYTWYKSYSGRDPDQPGYGLLTLEGELNTFNADALREIHARLEGIRAGRLEARVSGLDRFDPHHG
jgi:hypothetical protein